jgi:hypothetical protein
MLKKLLAWVLAWGVVLLVAALLAVPAFAQVANPMLPFGSDAFLTNEFGDANGDMTPFCQSIQPSAQEGWMKVFPNLSGMCGW